MTGTPEIPEEGIDIYHDDLEPVHTEWGTLYVIRLPRPAERKSGNTIQCYLAVHKDGYCELWEWYWFGETKIHARPWIDDRELRHKQFQLEQEIWEWLREWELVELKPIGPEDKEYFATEKLTKGDNVDWPMPIQS